MTIIAIGIAIAVVYITVLLLAKLLGGKSSE
jgi:hypothetical protein